MAKISLFLDIRRVGAGKEGALRIRIQHNNTNADYFTGIHLARECWDSERQMVVNHRLAFDYNRTIFNMLDKWNSALLRVIDTIGLMNVGTARELKDEIVHIIYPGSAKDKKKVRFIKRYISFMNRKSQGTKSIYMDALKKMQAFDPGLDSRGMEDITPQWLRDFEDFMAQSSSSANGRSIKFRCIRAVFNAALVDEVTTYYPFRKFKIKQTPTRKRALTVGQLRELIHYPLDAEDGHLKEYRDIFVLMFYLVGVNAVDLLLATPDQVHGERFEYTRAKTGRPYSIRIEPEAAQLIEAHRGTGHLIEVMDRRKGSYKDWLRDMDVALKKIGPYTRKGLGGKKIYDPIAPDISQYWCRHTWATIAASLDIPKETIAAALGHGGNSVTDIYIDFDRRKIDRANRRVIDYVLYDKM